MDAIKESLFARISDVPHQVIPFISVGMVVIAVLLVIVFFAVCVIYVNSKPKPIVRRDAAPKTDNKAAVAPQKIRHEDLPILSGRLGEILSMHGILHAGPITKIFFQVLDVIRNSTYDLRWRYKLPCFMVVGPVKSGKSTLLNSLNLEHLTADGSAIDSMWKLFRKGALFELPKTVQKEDEAKFWSFISELFSFIRPRRPLDGIIVTLPADVLLENGIVEQQASEIFNRIFKFQHDINFRLPIYLIITKSDLIPGFSEFVYSLNDAARQQMFGWSCPYAINNAFSAAWIDEAFNTIGDGIRQALIHIASEQRISSNLEQAAVFETHVMRLKQTLSKYLNTMFSSHRPEDGLILRGIYFTGQPREIIKPSQELLQPLALSPDRVQMGGAGPYNNSLCFVQDLFTEKIFKEYNIAHPINLNSVNVSQVTFRNKILLAGSITALSFGWLVGNNNIRLRLEESYHSLNAVKRSIVQIRRTERNITDSSDRVNINNQISSLLQNMPAIKRGDITSVFVPQSWFSGIYKDVTSTLGLIFDSVVARAMYIDLNFNTYDVLQNYGDNIKDHKKDLFDIKSFQSFKNLQQFVEKLSNLKKASTEYNSIHNLDDSNILADLTSTLFNDKFEITETMKGHVPNRRVMPPKFDIEKFRPKIEAKLQELFSAFLKDVFDEVIAKILDNIASDIEKIEEASTNPTFAYSQAQLAKTYNKLILLTDILKNKKFAWIAQEHFAPIKEYESVVAALKGSDMISAECTNALLNRAEREFYQYKTKLRTFSTTLTKELVSSSVQTPSVGVENLKKELHALLAQPFICASTDNTLVTTVFDDKMLLWDVSRLRKLSDLIDKYHAFSENMPADISAQRHDMYKIIAQKCFSSTVTSMIGEAEIFADIPVGNSKQSLEEAYKRQANNLRNVSSMLAKAVQFFDEIKDDDEKSIELTSLLVAYNVSFLEKIDALLNMETPYTTGKAVFDNWDGDQRPKFLDINDSAGLREYLTAQFERIRFLAKDLASPIVDLLAIPSVYERITNKHLIAKWREIIKNVDDYEAKKPGNSIAALEEFVTNSISKVSVAGFDSQGEIKDISETSGDFFLSKRSEVAKSLLSRVDVIQYEQAAEAYNSLRKFFNDKLSNKVPFGLSENDSTIQDVSALVKLIDTKCKNISEVLERHSQEKSINPDAITFLSSINKIMPFLRSWVKHAQGSNNSEAHVLFKVLVRPSPETEAFTSSVLERKITVDDTEVNNDQNGVFFNGNKVNAVFRWVASADEQPYANPSSAGNPVINSAQAVFAYAGQWAMFRLIEEHKLNKGIEYPDGVTLQFNVPIIDKSQNNTIFTSKMILKITPLVKEEDKVTPIAWPVFPTECPDLHGRAANKATVDESMVDIPETNVTPGTLGNAGQPNAVATAPLDVGVSFDDVPPADGVNSPVPSVNSGVVGGM